VKGTNQGISLSEIFYVLILFPLLQLNIFTSLNILTNPNILTSTCSANTVNVFIFQRETMFHTQIKQILLISGAINKCKEAKMADNSNTAMSGISTRRQGNTSRPSVCLKHALEARTPHPLPAPHPLNNVVAERMIDCFQFSAMTLEQFFCLPLHFMPE